MRKEKMLIIELKENISDLGNLIIKNDSIKSLEVSDLRTYKKNLIYAVRGIELILNYIDSDIYDKILNNNELDIIDKIIQIEG